MSYDGKTSRFMLSTASSIHDQRTFLGGRQNVVQTELNVQVFDEIF